MKIIVIGAGVFGASTAYHLVRSGAEVTLIDREDEGRATSAGAGIVSPWATVIEDPAIYALLAGGARYYPQLIAALAEDGETEIGYSRVGALYVPESATDLDAAERRILSRTADAPEAGTVERVSPDDAQRLFPPLRSGAPGIHVSGGARVNGRLLAAALRRAAATRGARVLTGSAALIMRGDRVTGVTCGTDTLEADAVVVAAGAWAPDLLAPAGVKLALAPQRGQIVHLRLPGTDTSHWPTLQPLNSYYLLAFDDSRVVIGATREFGSGFDYRLTAGGVAEVLNIGLHVAPGLATWTLHEIRIGFRPLADDNRPMIGGVRGIDGLFIANGLGASGLTMGPYGGALLADAILGRQTEMPIGSFDPLRGG
jgi:D-amino-acid dehydrogenase